MNFDLIRPCEKCPFRTDCLKGWLGRRRAQEIADALFARDQTFACHETTRHDDEGEMIPHDGEQHCAGAMILMERKGRANQLMRIAERIGIYDRQRLDMAAPVFKTAAAFVRHHAEERKGKAS